MSVEFKNNSIQVKHAIRQACLAWLHEGAGELESEVKKNQRRYNDTGQTAASWTYIVDENTMEATIGSNMENAIWEEFGTGQYALNGNGRKTPWKYQDAKGDWHRTSGKRPRRHLFRAMESKRDKVKKALEAKMKEMDR